MPGANEPSSQTDLTRRFEADEKAMARLAAGRRQEGHTGFTNIEEQAMGLTDVVRFLVEDELKAKGGAYSRGADWGSYVVSDGLLITGQNPASSAAAAALLLRRVGAVKQ